MWPEASTLAFRIWQQYVTDFFFFFKLEIWHHIAARRRHYHNFWRCVTAERQRYHRIQHYVSENRHQRANELTNDVTTNAGIALPQEGNLATNAGIRHP